MKGILCKTVVLLLVAHQTILAQVVRDYELRNGDVIPDAQIEAFTATGVVLKEKSGTTKEYRLYEFSNASRIALLSQFFSGPDAPYYGMAYIEARYARKEFLKNNMRPLKDGIYVADVHDDSPAEKAGIQEGDVIVRWGNRRVHSMLSFYYAVQATRKNDQIPITIKRWHRSSWRPRQIVLDPLTPEELRQLERQRRLAEQQERERRRRQEEERRRGPIQILEVSSANLKRGRMLRLTIKNTGRTTITACKFEIVYLDSFNERVATRLGIYDDDDIHPGGIEIIFFSIPKSEFIRKVAVRPVQSIDSNGMRWFGNPPFKISKVVRLR